MTYSLDFRKKVLSIKSQEGLSFAKTALRFGIGKTTLVNWLKEIEPKLRRNKPATKIDMQALAEEVRQQPDAYIYERARRFGVSRAGIWKALGRLKVSYKKNAQSPKGQSRRKAYLPAEDNKL